jgi:hypothetical protein
VWLAMGGVVSRGQVRVLRVLFADPASALVQSPSSVNLLGTAIRPVANRHRHFESGTIEAP